MGSKVESAILQLERLLREGHGAAAQKLFLDVSKLRIPPDERARWASYAYRVGVPLQGVRLLNPIVRSSGRRVVNARDDEKAVYAVCLARCGGAEEALRLLDEVNVAQTPEAHLFRVHALLVHWRYEEAIGHLERYLRHRLSPYKAAVAKINLIASLIYVNRTREALGLLREVMHEASVRKWKLLYGNALHLAALAAVLRRDWPAAKKRLAEAESALADNRLLDSFLVEKWKAVVAFLEKPRAGGLDKLRRRAQELGQWETVRECDRFTAEALGDDELWKKVFFGTPYASYRKNLQQRRKTATALPSDYRWTVRPGRGVKTLDLVEGPRAPKLSHLMLLVLARDFYSPVRIAALFHELYPEDFFHPIHSVARVHALLHRTREWLARKKLPIRIVEENGAYRIEATAPLAIRLPGAEARLPVAERIRELWGARAFSMSEAVEKLQGSRRTLQRELDRLVENKRLVRTGGGRSTKYRVA